MTRLPIAIVALCCASVAHAQSSASYKLSEHVFNAGGRPAQAVVSGSPSYRLSLDSIGESIAGHALAGASYRLAGGVVAAYPPPGEVNDLEVSGDAQTLIWDPDPGSTAYNLYMGALTTLPGGYGTCLVASVPVTTWIDGSTPDPGSALFYLVTGANRLLEEGTKGYTSGGAERGNPSPCP